MMATEKPKRKGPTGNRGGGIRCETCNKFVSLETGEPEVNNLEVDNDGQVTIEARLPRNSACCGDEIKAMDFSLETTLTMPDDFNPNTGEQELIDAIMSSEDALKKWREEHEHELEIEETGNETTEKGGGGRYAKSFYGVRVDFKVTCGNGCDLEIEGSVEDEASASEFEVTV